MKYLSLFTGIGGFELGIQQAHDIIRNQNRRTQSSEERKHNEGSELHSKDNGEQPICIGYSEIDKYAIQTYQSHFNHKNYGDITKINEQKLPDFDFLCGGFPCQSFSIAGKRWGFNDTRGTLFFDIARILKAKQPRLLLLENVKGLLSHNVGKTFTTIISTLDELGYDLQWQVLNSKNFGVPQNRERVFIVGHLRGTPRPKVFPFGETDKGIDVGESEFSREIQADPQRQNKSNIDSPILEDGKDRPLCGVLDDYNHRMRTDGNVGTVRATFGNKATGNGNKIIEGMKIRRFTPLECERLQGFPDNWTQGISDTQRYKCCGNAVTVNVIQAIMKKLL